MILNAHVSIIIEHDQIAWIFDRPYMFPVLRLIDDTPDSLEQLGTKEKYWFRNDNKHYLFKIGRPNTGENWSEKIAAELADLLGLPHASYDLAIWRGNRGVLSPQFVPTDGRLILGNELLAEHHEGYPQHEVRKVKDHTLGRIHALLTRPAIELPPDWPPPSDAITQAFDLFLGYLLLDTWIANQDRHHENWGLIRHQEQIYLAPTFDHAASMGQNETDKNREDRLTTKDKGRHISTYVKKARSAIYEHKTSKKPMLCLELFKKAASKSPSAADFWLDQLHQIEENDCQELFSQLPLDEVTQPARDFALTLLALNKQRLLALRT
ncbi:MAG: hypothetical protein PVI92_12675 [Chromatiales bacterium]